ncbi:MAG: acyl carrier protein [Gammaproteobacteria bacterium]|nr:acyl carrier protein [Gammaproteobacteria bacterium]
MPDRDEIYTRLVDVLEELFEIDRSEITPEKNLYEDLDIDSIDAVDMMIKLKDLTGQRLEPDDFKSVRTVQDVVESLEILLKEAS